MQVHPFCLVPASALVSVEATALLAVRRWAGEWGIAADAVTLRARRACDHGTPAAPAAWTRVRAQDRHAYAAWDRAGAEALRTLMFAPEAGVAGPGTDGASLALAAGRRALDALTGALPAALVQDAHGAPEPCVAPAATLYARGAGAVLLSVAIGGSELYLVLDHACVRALRSPDGAPALPPLPAVDFTRALADTEVALDLTIGTARVGLGNLMTLAVGDVIRLGTSVEQPVALSLPSGAIALNGYMGKSGGQVAVELTRLN